jgi:hypothetical protein
MTKVALLRLLLKKRNEAACRLGVTYPQFLGFLLLPPQAPGPPPFSSMNSMPADSSAF